MMATNPSRFEPVEAAQQRELALRKIWSRHQGRVHLAEEIETSASRIAKIIETLIEE